MNCDGWLHDSAHCFPTNPLGHDITEHLTLPTVPLPFILCCDRTLFTTWPAHLSPTSPCWNRISLITLPAHHSPLNPHRKSGHYLPSDSVLCSQHTTWLFPPFTQQSLLRQMNVHIGTSPTCSHITHHINLWWWRQWHSTKYWLVTQIFTQLTA
jgi:hypothetical protein